MLFIRKKHQNRRDYTTKRRDIQAQSKKLYKSRRSGIQQRRSGRTGQGGLLADMQLQRNAALFRAVKFQQALQLRTVAASLLDKGTLRAAKQEVKR